MSEAGEDVVLVDNYTEHVDALNRFGARITGRMNRLVPVMAIRPEGMTGKYDLIISLTKQTTMAESLKSASCHLHDQSLVLTLQNGVPEDISRKIVGDERVMGGCVEFGATWKEPGISELTTEPSSLGFTFGCLDGRTTEKTRETQKILSCVGPTKITTNLMGLRYSKLIDNSTFSGMSAVLGCCWGEILDSFEAMTVIAHLGREASLVVEKLGVRLEKIFGFQPLAAKTRFSTQPEMRKVIDHFWIPQYTRFRDVKASMLQDLEKGRKCEIDHINGKFVEKAREVGVDVPFMRTVVDVVAKLENREFHLNNAWENLKCFQSLKTAWA